MNMLNAGIGAAQRAEGEDLKMLMDEKVEKTVRRSIRNSELTVPKEKRAFLTYPMDGLAHCTLEEAEDGVEMLFETSGLIPAVSVLNKSREDQYRFLINSAALEKLSTEYEFSISPDNLLMDINLRPQVMLRDSSNDRSIGFLPRYRALIGSVLQKKYKYEDYLEGGEDLYRKNKLLKRLVALDSTEAIAACLTQNYHETVNSTKSGKRLVSKRNAYLCRVVIPMLTAAILVSSFFLWKSLLQDIPFKDDIIKANSDFIANNFIDVQRTLSVYGVSELSYETRHILSRSYVITEALTDDQKEHVLMGLTLRAESVVFDYWILLGRLQFVEAIDIAQRLGDDELLLFAYVKYEVVIRNDTMMGGEEKTALLGDIRGRIDSLQRAREAAAKEALEE
jgi:type VII secretion protein EssB